MIISEIEESVHIFDKSKSTCLATNWLRSGLGYWLFQKHLHCTPIKPFCCHTSWKITLVSSRFNHAAESCYAPIEAVTVTNALDKVQFFVLGCSDMLIAMNCKPLLKVFGDHSLEEITNAKLCNLKEKTSAYRFRIVHIPGVQHKAADAISCHLTAFMESALLILPDDIATTTDLVTPLPLDLSGYQFLAIICYQLSSANEQLPHH